MNIEDLRRNYAFGSLTHEKLPNNPIQFFSEWFSQLRSVTLPDWFEINAMTLSTVNQNGGSSSRIVLLKSFDDQGFRFFTNYRSDKGCQIAAQPNVALNFFWPMLERQVRVEGIAQKTSASISDEYFAARPRSSQLGAAVSPQSEVIADDSELANLVVQLDRQLEGQPVPRPAHWGGYQVTPMLIEFWQGRPSRLHDRFRYRRDIAVGPWRLERLAP